MFDIFSYEDFSFPKDFLFGSATAGHQIEGNNIHSSNWAWEIAQQQIDPNFEPSGLAVNSYEMYDEDSAMGVNVIGYLHWSLLDNYEWGSFMPRYGLVDVDRKSGFKRTIKNSGYYFRDIIEHGGFSQEILRKYLTEMPRVKYGLTQKHHILDNVNNNTVFMGGI